MKLQSGCGNVIVKWLQHLLFTDMTGNIFYSHFPDVPRRRKWQPTPVFFPRESHGQGSLVGYSPGGLKELDMTVTTHACMHT